MDRQRRSYDDDDGYTIADMDVDGMPWHRAGSTGTSRREAPRIPSESLSFRQRLSACGGILAAIALVTAVFGGAFYLVIQLLDMAWR